MKPHNFPVVELSLDHLPSPLVEEITAGTIVTTYIGMADLGSKTSDKVWYIRRITTDSSVVGTVSTKVEYPAGKMSYENAWSDRATLTYAR